jgi:hypothetical protein
MFRAICCLFACLLAAGCQQAPPPTSYAHYDLGGGRYYVEIKDTGSGSSLKFHSHSEGDEVTEEHYEVRWGADRHLVIEDGELTVNGEKRGTLQPKDRVVINNAGELSVNGSPR